MAGVGPETYEKSPARLREREYNIMKNHNTHHGDHPAVHGMLIVGEETIYLSHLPMFMSPHDHQVILEVTLAKEESDPQAVYSNDRRETGMGIYTLVPERFSLPDLVPTDSEHVPLKAFKGTIFRGHFERGGTPIISDVDINIENVVRFRKFDPDAKELDRLQYFVFGKGQELFLAHLITKKPDFDQILSVKILGHEFTDEELSQGVPVAFPGRANSKSDRIREQEQVSGEVQVIGECGSETLEVQIEAGKEFYFEAEELS
jgi:hypothetical protein